MSQHGILPPDDKLAGLLDSLSERHYNGLYAPGATLYNVHRPPRWRTSKAICKAHGLPGDRVGWRNLTARLGLCKPVTARGVTWDPQVRDFRLEQRMSEFLDCPLDWPFEQLAEERRRDLAGMAAIEPIARCWPGASRPTAMSKSATTPPLNCARRESTHDNTATNQAFAS